MNECPACGSNRTVKGRCYDPIGGVMSQVFQPFEQKLVAISSKTVSIAGGDKFTACLDCGHLWSSVNPKKLTKVMQDHGKKKVKIRLKLNN